MIFNMNDKFRVVLTAKGAEIINAYYASIPVQHQPESHFEGETVCDQLWCLFSIFGEHISMGCDVPFKNNEITPA